MSGLWSIVVPETTTNLFSDPSFELADPDTQWTISGDGAEDVTQYTGVSMFGRASAAFTIGGGTYVILYQSASVFSSSYTLSCYAYYAAGTLTNTQMQAYFNNTNSNWDSITAVGGNWYLCVKTGTPSVGTRNFGVYYLSGTVYVDGMQFEAKGYRTTYCDGTQPGCYWTGTEHTSTSTRSAQSRAGGRVYNLDDYTAYVTSCTGIGMPPVTINAQNYAELPGAMYDSVKVQARPFVLTVTAKGSSRANLHALRKALTEIFCPDDVPNEQAFLLRYDGATGTGSLQIAARYEAGLEFGTPDGFSESIAMRFLALEPFWETIGERAAALDSNDTATLNYFTGRVSSAWSSAITPSAGGTVYAVAVGPDGYVYVGGNFTNWDGKATADYIAYWNGSAWSGLGTGVDGIVYALAFNAAGTLYVGGAFTNAIQHDAASLTVRTVTYWDGTHWQAMGPPNVAGTYRSVRALAFDHNGLLWIGGDFDNFDNIATADNLVTWSGSAYATATSAGSADGDVFAITVGLDNTVFVGGAFHNINAVATTHIAQYDGSTWTTMGTVPNDVVRALATAANGDIYAAGDFTTAGGETVNYVARWNGATWYALGSGRAAACYSLAVAPDGLLYVGANLTYLSRWNGSTWLKCDIDLPGAPVVYAVAIGLKDPVIAENYNLYIGFSTTGSAYYSGTVTATNSGTRTVYPKLVIYRSGGTTATIRTLRNETTGREIIFNDYAMLSGETVSVDLREGRVAVTSSWRGNIASAIQPGSDVATWGLQPGANTVTAFVATTGSPTMTAYLLWNELYWGAD